MIYDMAITDKLHIGVLGLQGDYECHQNQLLSLKIESRLVKLPHQLDEIDALILPGGESTTMDKLIDRFELREKLISFGKSKPIWGTCAGMILLSKSIIDNQSGVQPLGLIDIDVRRTAYGRQVFSFNETITADLDGKKAEFEASFIRAPRITRVGKDVSILAEFNGEPVLIEKDNILASSFHTELGSETVLLRYFINKFLLANDDN